jgi:hypothetical protein
MQPSRCFFAVMTMLALLAAQVAPALAQDSSSATAADSPIPLLQGTQVGKTMFEPGDTAKGGNGQPVDGIEGSIHEMLKSHTHAHLSLFYRGEQIAIPAAIGIIGPSQAKDGFVGDGRGFYWLHTHDATGIIHIEAPDGRAFTLGNFFNIWGQPINQGNVAGLKGTVRAFVNGKPHAGDVRDIRLNAHDLITLVVGKPVPTPPRYTFPQGL